MFGVGDTVFYPMHGVGWVEAIEERCVRGATDTYYVLSFRSEGLRVLLPVNRAEAAGLRELSAPETVLAVYEGVDDECDDEFANWNRRYRYNLERMKKGDMRSMACVARSLCARSAGRGLSAGEKNMLKNALRFLGDEYAQVTGNPAEDMEKRYQELYGSVEQKE